MHYHLEIVMPPVEDIELAISQIMKPFDENNEDEEDRSSYLFWGFYVIGGRYSGEKLEQSFDQERLQEFRDELVKRKVTVSGLQAGKQELSPSSQIPMVDELWREYFPSGGDVCLLFSHYNDQYKNSNGYPDIMTLKDIPANLKASHVIVAGPSYKADGSLEARTMYQNSMWNGVSHVPSDWDGKLKSVIDKHVDNLKNAQPDHKQKHLPTDEWKVITVDYHS